jgi:hypothetical protein
MNFFTLTKLGQTLLLVAVLAVGSVSAEEALFYSSSGSGGSDLARLRYDGNVFKQTNGNSDYGMQPDFYFALKLYTVAGYGSYGLRGDFVFLRGNGGFHGLDVGIGFGSSGNTKGGFDLGLGYSYGRELCFDNNLQILLGGSVGFWMGGETELDIDPIIVDGEQPYAKSNVYIDFFGPFARVHWHSIELMYRILLGISSSAYQRSNTTVIGEQTMGFGARHQISIGYCFGKNPK